jgi:hypothetical protein
MTLTPEQLHILQHSLGCDQYGQTAHRANSDDHFGRYYRNHYVSDPTPDLRALVNAGFMKDYPPSELYGGQDYHCYTVTEAGLTAMLEQSPKPPKLTRAQKRYQEYLDADCGMTFGEWLKRREAYKEDCDARCDPDAGFGRGE